MSAMVDRVRVRAAARAEALAQDAAELLREALPGVTVQADGAEIRLIGRGITRRWREGQADHLLRSHLR